MITKCSVKGSMGGWETITKVTSVGGMITMIPF